MSNYEISLDSLLSHRTELPKFGTACKKLSGHKVSKLAIAEDSITAVDSLLAVARDVGEIAVKIFKKIPKALSKAVHATSLFSVALFPFTARDLTEDVVTLATSDLKGKDRAIEAVETSLDITYHLSNLLDCAHKILSVVINLANLTGRVVKASNIIGHVSTVLNLVTLVIDARTLYKCADAYFEANKLKDDDVRKPLQQRVLIGGFSTTLNLLATAVSIVGMALLLFVPVAAPAGIALLAVAALVSFFTFGLDLAADYRMKQQFKNIPDPQPIWG